MKILLTGATGLIGTGLRRRLAGRGHEIVCVARRPPADVAAARGERWIAADFAARTTAAAWHDDLRGVDVVVNAVGIFRERGRQTFEALHVRAPCALFDACVAAGVRRVVQVSALGAAADAPSAYLRTKHAADHHLLGLPLQAVVVQPSLVFAADGASARWFLALATLPLLPLPAGGRQPVQPVHLDDAATALRSLVEDDGPTPRHVALVGPRPLTLGAYLQALRRALRLQRAPSLPVPAALVALAAAVGDRLPASLFDRASWAMLQRGSTAAADGVARLLGRAPREAETFVDADQAAAVRTRAQLRWLLPLLRLSIALVWLVTGIVSLGVFPVAESHALLARAGVPTAWQPAALVGAAALDLLLGVLTLAPLHRRARRRLWAAQAALMALYMVVIALRLPEFWIHPYAPLLKNLPMLAALLLLATLDDDDDGDR